MKESNFGANLHNRLKELGISQVSFAQMVGIKPCTLSLIITGKRGASEEVALKIATALDTTVEDLLACDDSDVEAFKLTEKYRREVPGFHYPSFKAGIKAALSID